MSSAAVRSFDAIQRVREQLLRFAHQTQEGLTEIEAEVRRVLDWLENDRPAYWKLRVRKAHDGVGEARGALERAMMFRVNDEDPACTEQKAALKAAQAELRRCEDKQQRLREIIRELRHEVHEYKGRVAQLKQVIEIDTPRGAATLERSLAVLECYAAAGSSGKRRVASEPIDDAPPEAPPS